MSTIEYSSFTLVSPEQLLIVVNEDELRTHLVNHEYFDSDTIREWMAEKIRISSLAGCRIRAVYIAGELAGWCGIQPYESGFEIAIVLSKRFWGHGIRIFKTVMRWALALGHDEIVFHLLDSRPEYKSLRKLAKKVEKTNLMDRVFTTYYISVRKSGHLE